VQGGYTRDKISIEVTNWPTRYVGEIGVSSSALSTSSWDLWTVQDLSAWGTKGANKARLIKPVLDLPVIVGELAEAKQLVTGLGSLVRHIRAAAKTDRQAIARIRDLIRGSGEQNLYLAFGVYPILETLERLNRLESSISRAIARIDEIEGKWIHREIVLLDDDRVNTTTVSDGVFPPKIAQTWMGTNEAEIVDHIRDKIWFSTWIRLKLPKMTKPERYDYLRDKLLGGPPSGKVLYELAPYSWMADWFTSAGAFVANAMDHTLYQWKFPCTMHETSFDRKVTGRLELVYGSERRWMYPKGYGKFTVKRREPFLWSSIGISAESINTFRGFIAASLAASRI